MDEIEQIEYRNPTKVLKSVRALPTLRERMQYLLDYTNLSQGKLAKVIGVSRNSVNGWMAEPGSPRRVHVAPANRAKLAQAFGLPPSVFVDDEV